MNAVRQKCRPKHQVLVLKCYPRFQKNIQEVKPNSSELSYLLYYASTRRSKLQKVGLFLEKRTASDVWRLKLGNVQVTLQILTALMEKAPRDLPLYSNSVLTILETVLKSNDINMIEESLPTFDTYCKYQDLSSLASDQHRSLQYQNIVRMYADFAGNDFPSSSSFKQKPSKPMAMRYKTAGLKAIRSVVGAEALGTDGTKQLSIVMPVILENLYSGNDDILPALQEKAQAGEKTEMQNARKRRMSIATVTTVDTVDANLASASETTADADKAAENEVRVFALRCLKQIFEAGTGSNRGQVQLATILTLKFITGKDPPSSGLADSHPISDRWGNWATSLIETVTRWTPVQDRYIIVTTAVDTLIQSPMVESQLKQQLALATMIDWLLSSSINLIGLSVMDVLLGIIQHVLLLLQLGGRASKIASHDQQAQMLEADSAKILEKGGRSHGPGATTPSPIRQELLLRLQKCIGDLATHIYYTDQISDMMSAILARLKPSANSDVSSTAAAIENPGAAAIAIANSVNLREDPLTDGFFSFATARASALRAVKNVLLVANAKNALTGTAAGARSRVGVHVWEGTQWLLRDEDREVRVAYVDALLTWLKLETNKNDLLLPREGSRKSQAVSKRGRAEDGDLKLTKRAVSNASRKESRTTKSTFLQLLHLAIYDNAIESASTDSDTLLLHLLMTNLTERLGVNAVRYGLPMITRLQCDLGSSDLSRDAKARLNTGSLIHGYLWALSEKFDFETNRVGSEIHSEISRRKRTGLWLDKIRLPALTLDQLVASSPSPNEKEAIIPDISSSAFTPFRSRAALVEEICASYNESLMAPTTSPPSSPGRGFSVPTLNLGYGYGFIPGPKPSLEDQLPPTVKDELLAEWSKDAVIAAVEREHSDSISGSRTGTGSARAGRNFLSVGGINGVGRDGSPTMIDYSPTRALMEGIGAGHRMSAMSYAMNGGLGNLQKLQKSGTDEGSPTPLSQSSSRESTVRVSELKRALSGYPSETRHASPLRTPLTVGLKAGLGGQGYTSSGSESLVSYNEADGGDGGEAVNGLGSDLNLNAISTSDFAPGIGRHGPQQQISAGEGSGPRPSSGSRHKFEHNGGKLPRLSSDPRLGEDVPPVPTIPSSLNLALPGTFPRDFSPATPAPSKHVVETRHHHHHLHHHHHQQQPQPQPQPQHAHAKLLPLRPSTAPGSSKAALATPQQMPQAVLSNTTTSTATSTPMRLDSLSMREGRSLRRGSREQQSATAAGMASVRPVTAGAGTGTGTGSSRMARYEWGGGTGVGSIGLPSVSGKKHGLVDLGKLLEGIRVEEEEEEGQGDWDGDRDGDVEQGGHAALMGAVNGKAKARARARVGEARLGGGGVLVRPPY